MNFLIKLIISTLAVMMVSYILPGVHVQSFGIALMVACVLAFLNALIKPILVLFTLPITLITLGLFLLVINAIIIIITDRLIDGFEVSSFGIALLFSLILSIVTSVMESLAGQNQNRRHPRAKGAGTQPPERGKRPRRCSFRSRRSQRSR